MDAKKPLLEKRMREAGLSGSAWAKLAGLDDAYASRARKKNIQAPAAEKLAFVGEVSHRHLDEEAPR